VAHDDCSIKKTTGLANRCTDNQNHAGLLTQRGQCFEAFTNLLQQTLLIKQIATRIAGQGQLRESNQMYILIRRLQGRLFDRGQVEDDIGHLQCWRDRRNPNHAKFPQ